MANAILESPLIKQAKPWWFPFLSLSLTLYGILVLGWNLQPIVFIIWWEIILMCGAALIRGLFALNGRPFWEGLFPKVFFLMGSALMFAVMIMLTVTFSFNVFENNVQSDGFERIPAQTRILTIGYAVGLILHYFANGRYKQANVFGELMQTMVHLLVLLTLLMVLTMHIIPAFLQLNQATWVGTAVVLVKFVVDLGFNKVVKVFKAGSAPDSVESAQ